MLGTEKTDSEIRLNLLLMLRIPFYFVLACLISKFFGEGKKKYAKCNNKLSNCERFITYYKRHFREISIPRIEIFVTLVSDIVI